MVSFISKTYSMLYEWHAYYWSCETCSSALLESLAQLTIVMVRRQSSSKEQVKRLDCRNITGLSYVARLRWDFANPLPK